MPRLILAALPDASDYGRSWAYVTASLVRMLERAGSGQVPSETGTRREERLRRRRRAPVLRIDKGVLTVDVRPLVLQSLWRPVLHRSVHLHPSVRPPNVPVPYTSVLLTRVTSCACTPSPAKRSSVNL